MDVVYLVRDGERNEELRHSLRSLANLTHGRVWIAGHRPSWVSESVSLIPTTQGGDKHENTWMNWWAIATAAEVSPWFILMNDDFFITAPNAMATPPAHAGPLLEWLAARNNIKTATRMHHTIAALHTRMHPSQMLSYEVHVPMVMERRTLAEVMAFGEAYRGRTLGPPLCKRSLYGNYVDLGGVLTEDPKIRDNRALPPRGAAIVSTSDTTFTYGRVGRWVRDRFREPSPYERARARVEARTR